MSVGIKPVCVPTLVAAGVVLLGGGSTAIAQESTSTAKGATLETLPRSTADRPDDFPGPQVHVFYVVPSDGADLALDTNGVIAASVASWQAWLRGQTGGRGIRVDTYQGQLDITFFRLATTDAAVAARGPFVREQIEQELRAAGFNTPGRIYAVYYDGGSTHSCGGAGPEPTTGGSVTAMYLKGTPPGAPPCSTNTLGVSPPGYFEFGMLHEIVHTMGFVPPCAPHVTLRDHVSDSTFDLMWAGNAPWGVDQPGRMQLDVNRDDYYLAKIPGCRDMSESRYLGDGGATLTITVTARGGAQGLVRSFPGGIDCPEICTAYFDAWPAQSVTLNAYPSAGSLFAGWRGACSGRNTICDITLDTSKNVEATFERATARLSVSVVGRGRVVSTPLGISCPARCSASYPVGTRVALRATPRRGWRFMGWKGACKGGGRCALTVTSNSVVRATFRRL